MDALVLRERLNNPHMTHLDRRAIIRLNDLLVVEEERVARTMRERIIPFAKELAEAAKISSYEIETRLKAFRYPVSKNDDGYFFSCNLHHLPDKVSREQNWNDCQSYPANLMYNDWHCYTLFHLYHHEHLSICDIASITEVQIECDVRFQFFSPPLKLPIIE